MQGFELAAISVAPSDFHNFFEVATGPCKNAVNRACGHFLSSLFSLLSFLCSLPSSLLGADPFLSHPAGPGAQQTLSVSQLLLFKIYFFFFLPASVCDHCVLRHGQRLTGNAIV